MNTGDHDLEKLLGKLAPAPPARELMDRLRGARPEIEGEARATRKVVPFRRWLPVMVAAAAACVAVVFVMERKTPVTPEIAITPPPSSALPTADLAGTTEESNTALVPLETRQHLMEVTDYGIVEDKSKKPVRLIGTTWLDEVVYAANADGKSVTESRMRQEILPVSVSTY